MPLLQPIVRIYDLPPNRLPRSSPRKPLPFFAKRSIKPYRPSRSAAAAAAAAKASYDSTSSGSSSRRQLHIIQHRPHAPCIWPLWAMVNAACIKASALQNKAQLPAVWASTNSWHYRQTKLPCLPYLKP
eukprot:GHRR01012910.1.p1 GENE.GHRR01012910.1~~GHRR01012910.1.p1  ORF type:complete len:129 (+),score=28.47 GHRR01012910.1:118-504(+)